MKKFVAAIAILCLSISFMGCGSGKQDNGQPSKGKQMVNEVQETVTGMAGGAAFKAAKNSKKKIGDINQKHNEELNRMMDE